MFPGDLTSRSVIRESGRPNVSSPSGKACASSRIGSVTQLRV